MRSYVACRGEPLRQLAQALTGFPHPEPARRPQVPAVPASTAAQRADGSWSSPRARAADLKIQAAAPSAHCRLTETQASPPQALQEAATASDSSAKWKVSTISPPTHVLIGALISDSTVRTAKSDRRFLSIIPLADQPYIHQHRQHSGVCGQRFPALLSRCFLDAF